MKNFVDLKKLIKTIWILLWVILFILLIYKILFNKWYPIIIKNNILINVCNFIDNHKIIYYIITYIFYLCSNYIIYLTCTNRKKLNKFKEFISLFIIILFIYISKILNNIGGNLLEILLIICYILDNIKFNNFINKRQNIIIPIFVYIILNIWQLNILIIRNIFDIHINEMPSLIGFSLQLDYYIFILITWIGGSYMGLWSMGWFFGKDITTLKAEKEKELAKEQPNKDLIKKIDEKILELENEENKN